MFSNDEIESIDVISQDLILWVCETRGVGIKWLDDDQRRRIAIALDSDAPGDKRLQDVLDVIEQTVDDKAVADFLRHRKEKP